jgi:hypothetical protein
MNLISGAGLIFFILTSGMPQPDFCVMQPALRRVEVCLRPVTIIKTTIVSGPDTTEQLVCDLPHENENNPHSAHIQRKLFHVFI